MKNKNIRLFIFYYFMFAFQSASKPEAVNMVNIYSVNAKADQMICEEHQVQQVQHVSSEQSKRFKGKPRKR